MPPPEPPKPRNMTTAMALAEIHLQRVCTCAAVQAVLVIPVLLCASTCLHLLGGTTGAHWGWSMVALLLAILGQWIIVIGRYLILFHPSITKAAQFFVAQTLAAPLISTAFNLTTEEPERYYKSISLLSAFASSVALAISHLWYKGYDVRLPDYRLVITPGGTNYRACFWPSCINREAPWKAQAQTLFREGSLWLFKSALCFFGLPISGIVLVVCGPYLDGLGWASRTMMGQGEDPHQWLDKATRPWGLLWLTSFVVASYMYVTFTLGTDMLSHVFFQPLDFTQLSGVDYLLGPQVGALSLGREPILRDSTGGGQAAFRPPDLAQWRKELQVHEEVMLRIAALVDTRYFPPVINSHNNISVADKISRSLAFMDLAIFTQARPIKRRFLYRSSASYPAVAKVLLAVINSLTLELQMHLVAMSKVKGGPVSPLDTLNARAGVELVIDGEYIAKLLVETEVQKRLDSQALLMGVPEGDETVAQRLSPRELTKLDLAAIDVQVVELAIRSLQNLLVNAYNKAGASMEDAQSYCRHTVPSALNSLLALQLAIHLYSAVMLGDHNTPRFLRLRDRDSVVLPLFRDISLAIDQTVEGVAQVYHDPDFSMYAFPPLYAKCLKAFVTSMRGRTATSEDEVPY